MGGLTLRPLALQHFIRTHLSWSDLRFHLAQLADHAWCLWSYWDGVRHLQPTKLR
jgi:hypothetical protein